MSASAARARAAATRLEWTGSGRVLLFLACGASFVATFGPGLARPLAALAWATLLSAAWLAWWHVRTLELYPPRPARAAAGTRLVLECTARVRGADGAALLLTLAESHGEAPLLAGRLCGASGAEALRLALVWRVKRRGRVRRLVVRAASTHPLGLARVTRCFELDCDLLGLPRRGTLAPELARSGARVLALRGRAARGDEELVTVRDWRAGESLRRVHWRLSARRGRAIVRELATPAESDVELTLESELDQPERRARSAAFERAVALAATLAEHRLRAGRRLTLVLGGEVRARGLRGRHGLARALALLAEVAACGPRAAPLAPVRSTRAEERLLVRAGAGRACLAPAPGTRVLDVDAPRGDPGHAPWHEAHSGGAR